MNIGLYFDIQAETSGSFRLAQWCNDREIEHSQIMNRDSIIWNNIEIMKNSLK